MNRQLLSCLGVVFLASALGCAAETNAPIAAIAVDRIHASTKAALARGRPGLNIEDFYLQRVTHQVVFAPGGQADLDTIDATYRRRPADGNSTAPETEIMAIRVELDATGAIRRLILAPRNGATTGAIIVPLSSREDARLVEEGLLPPKE